MKIEQDPHVAAVIWRFGIADIFLIQMTMQTRELRIFLMTASYLARSHLFLYTAEQSIILSLQE